MANEELPEGQEKPKKSKKGLLIIFALILLLGGGGFGAYWFLTQNPDIVDAIFKGEQAEKTEAEKTETAEKPAEGEAPKTEEGKASPEQQASSSAVPPTHLVSLPAVTINLADTGSARYLNVGIDIEVSSKEAVQAIEKQSAKIRDAIIILLSGKTYQSLSSTSGKIQIKNEIASRVNQILNSPQVLQVYFTDFVVR